MVKQCLINVIKFIWSQFDYHGVRNKFSKIAKNQFLKGLFSKGCWVQKYVPILWKVIVVCTKICCEYGIKISLSFSTPMKTYDWWSKGGSYTTPWAYRYGVIEFFYMSKIRNSHLICKMRPIKHGKDMSYFNILLI